MARDPRAARVDGVGHRLHRRHAERRLLHTAGRVHVDLHEIGAEVELMERRVLQAIVIGGDPHVRVAGLADPGPRDAHVRIPALPRELVAHVERDRPAIGARRADVTSPQHARLDETVRVLTRDLPQHGRRIAAAHDPVTAALHREVAVAVDHARHDDRATGVDDGRALLIDLVVRADRLDLPARDRDAHAEPERVGRAVGERGVVKDRAGHLVLPAGPVLPPAGPVLPPAGPVCPSPWYFPL